MEKYLLSCESPVDLSYSYVNERGISVINYYYLIDGEPHIDDMGKDPNSLNKFYQFLKEGKLHIAVESDCDFFEAGKGSIDADRLREKFTTQIRWFTDMIDELRLTDTLYR